MEIKQLDLNAQYQSIKDEIKKAIDRVLEKQAFILGEEVELLEKEVASFCNAKYAVSVASGSDALFLALESLKVGKNHEVITTPFTFFATAGAISRCGAKPVFVDIDSKTYNIDPGKIEKAITKNTKAIIPVHLFGQCADMDPISALAKKHNLKIVEDAAQSIGAKYKGKDAGTMGDAGALSFFPSKNLGGYGDGGMILTSDPSTAENLRDLRVHGSKDRYIHHTIGYNSRLDALQAVVLRVKLKYLDRWNKARVECALRYNGLFKGVDIITPYAEPHNLHVYHQYSIRVKNRDDLAKFLTQKKIGAAVYYPLPLHLQQCYRDLGYKQGDFPVSEKVCKEILALPIYPELTQDKQEIVAGAIREWIKKT